MPVVKFISSISKIAKTDWQTLCGTDFPFTRYEFLASLENSGAAVSSTGWRAHHTLVYDDNRLIAVMPGYLKDHSYGEFVFDFQWAEAYQRSGLPYYPKLISAIPFSPVTGPRLCVRDGCDVKNIAAVVLETIKQITQEKNLSSWHVLFPEKLEADIFTELGLLTRMAVHFQWFNKNSFDANNSYASFNDFLETFSSRKRKNLRKEREKVAEQGITLQRVEGKNITTEMWERFYHFYQLTYAKRSGHGGYLSKDFFSALGNTMPENLMMVVAYKDNNIIAAALNLKDKTTLYGRYWGCYEEYDFLHFETCYYQGIEYCIDNNLQRFDPGVQGEHKIQRGFTPVYTYSNHWIADARFRDAIADFLMREQKHIALYKEQAESLLPFKHN